ncbi:MAG: hypothetical protein NTW03_03930 [Verrucomicrobia bacterium]|nr:hypothetical protein [Verrucomicrobiota bacterium]
MKYTIEFKESLTDSWAVLTQMLGDGGMATVLDSDQPGRNRFYRVRAE